MIRTAGRVSRVALMILMVALTLGAALVIVVLLTDAAEDLGPRLLGTAGFAALAALTGLVASLLLGRGGLAAVAVIGIVVSAATFLLGMAYVWDMVQPTTPEGVRPLGVAVGASIAIGWASLLLLLLGRSIAVTLVALLTVASIAAFTGLVVTIILLDEAPGTTLARATALAAVLAALGSFLTPLLDHVIGGRPRAQPTDGANDPIHPSWAG